VACYTTLRDRIDATMPFGRKHEFARKKIPGVDRINLRNWIA